MINAQTCILLRGAGLLFAACATETPICAEAIEKNILFCNIETKSFQYKVRLMSDRGTQEPVGKE